MLKKLLVTGLTLLSVSTPLAHAQTMSAARTLIVNVGNAGQQLNVQSGDVLKFNLSGSAGTGYTWHVLDVNPDYLVLLDRQVGAPAAAPSATPVVGGQQQTTYSFYVKQSMRTGNSLISVPVVFVALAPGRNTASEGRLIQFDLTTK